MARSRKAHMKLINICKNYTTLIKGFTVPKHAIYGRDNYGYYVIVNKSDYGITPITYDCYRYDNTREEWVLLQDHSNTMQEVHNLLHNNNAQDLFCPVEYPKYTGAKRIAETSHLSAIRKFKIRSIKNNTQYEINKTNNTLPSNRLAVKLDAWERVVSHC